MQRKKNWIQKAVKNPGAFTRKAEARGMTTAQFAARVRANPARYGTATVRQANLARTLRKVRKAK